jgi:hypothetical protein
MHGQKKILEDRRGNAAQRGGGDEGDKPIATALIQEFQNLKDKFKSEDGDGEKGIYISTLPSSSIHPLQSRPTNILKRQPFFKSVASFTMPLL